MENTKHLCTLLILSMLSTQVFAQKNVVWKWRLLDGKKKADKILKKSTEVKGKKNSQALKYFKGAIVKKYKISENDPYFNVGDGATVDRSDKSSAGSGTHDNYIVSLKRIDTYDKDAFLDGEFDKAQSFRPPASEIKTTRKFRCYQYTIGNSAEGKADYKKESQCFLINSNGYVAGEDPDVHDYDNSVSEIKTNSIGLGCLKISRCEPRNIKVKQSSSGTYRENEGDKKTWLGKLFSKNKSKRKNSKSDRFKQRDNKMSIQSCVGGCSEGYKMIKVKYALDSEEAPIRDEISKYCGELEESRYEPLGNSNSYAGFVQNSLDGKNDRLLQRGFSDVYSTDSDPLQSSSSKYDENRASQHFIYVNRCVSVEEIEGRNGNPEDGGLKRPKFDGRKDKKKKGKNGKPEDGGLKRGSNKPAQVVFNGPVTINQANGANGTVLNSGGFNNQGWGNGVGGYQVIPGYANLYPQYTTAGVSPGIIILNIGGLQAAPQVIGAGQVLTPVISGTPSQFINPGNITYNNQGQVVYNNSTNPKERPEIAVTDGETTEPYETLSSCYKEVTVADKNGSCVIDKKQELFDSGQNLKQVYEHLCREISKEEFQKVKKSLQAQCLDKFTSEGIKSLAARDARERGLSLIERENFYRNRKIIVNGVEIQSSDFRSAGVRCIDSRKVSSDEDKSKDEIFLDINRPFISLNPSEQEIQELGLIDGKSDYVKPLKKYYQETLDMIDRKVDRALSPLDHQIVNDENVDKVLAMSSVNIDFQGMYSPTRSNSKEMAKKRHEVNSKAFAEHAKQAVIKKLSKSGLSEAKKAEYLKRVLKINERDIAHKAAYTVGPVRFDKDLDTMKKRIAESGYDCNQETSEELYKCSLKKGCNYFQEKKTSVPSALSFCSQINMMKSGENFNSWYDKHETLNASNEESLHDVEFNFFGLDINAKRDEGLVAGDKNERTIEIGCDQIENDGKYAREVVIHTVKFNEKGKKVLYTLDEDCAAKNNHKQIFNMIK